MTDSAFSRIPACDCVMVADADSIVGSWSILLLEGTRSNLHKLNLAISPMYPRRFEEIQTVRSLC